MEFSLFRVGFILCQIGTTHLEASESLVNTYRASVEIELLKINQKQRPGPSAEHFWHKAGFVR